MLGSKAVKHDVVSAEFPMCTDSFQNNLEKGMLLTLKLVGQDVKRANFGVF